MDNIVLFGTGRMLPYYMDMLKNIGLNPDFFSDNDENKHGKYINGIKILPPKELKNLNCKIIISCNFIEPIKKQLNDMGLGKNILDMQDILRKEVEKKVQRFMLTEKKSINKNRTKIMFDAFDGIGWGGMERWSYEAAKGLKNRGYDVLVYGSDWQEKTEAEIEKLICRFELKRNNFWETVETILFHMENEIPFILFNNWTEHVLVAAYMLKRKYPGLIKIISIVHNDCESFYSKQRVWQDAADKLAGVSRKICDNLRKKCAVESKKICYKENFYTGKISEDIFSRKSNESIKLGWGARLEILQKRADKLPDLIRALNKKNFPYEFSIAGNGPYFENLTDYVKKNNLMSKIHLLGTVPPSKMLDFWKKQHIYVNISEFEGTSLAMLDAIANGAVPVVTDVSGTDEFIEHGKSGYITKIGDFDAMADYIFYLYEHEAERIKMSKKAKKILREKADYKSYIDYLEGILKEFL